MLWCEAWAGRYGDRVQVLDWEISGQLSGLTADLAARVADTWPQAELAVAIGADQFKVFHTWDRGAEILDHAGLLVIPRGGMETDVNHAHHLRRQGHRITLLDTDPVVASSTAIRELRAAGTAAWQDMMVPEVAAHYREHAA
jgi:nicotinic acid mononucleotide adenylyltransferase